MYAIVKTGGKQYRVEQGQSLLVERLPATAEGDTVKLDPLLCVDGEKLVDGDELSKVTVQARVLSHERGPKLRVVKFKPKRGYKRRTGHRQDLTRLEVMEIKVAARRAAAAKRTAAGDQGAAEPKAAQAKPKAPAGDGGAAEPKATPTKPKAAASDEAAAKPKAAPRPKAAAKPKAAPKPKRAPKKEADDGS